jgi:hypothetical protein
LDVGVEAKTRAVLLLVLLLLGVRPPFRRGGDLLVKLINPDAAKPAVDLEQKELVESLVRLLLGDQVCTGAAGGGGGVGGVVVVVVQGVVIQS